MSKWIFPDIIRGDFGYPMVSLRNSRGMWFKFNRGNMKDFFDISRPNTPQRVRLPVAAFVHHGDLGDNPRDDGSFFKHPVDGVFFDFLCHPEHEIDIHLAAIEVEDAPEKPQLDVRDLVVFERVAQAKNLPRFSTSTGALSFVLSISPTGLALGYGHAAIDIEVLDSMGVLSTRQLSLASTTHCTIELPYPGPFRLRASLSAPLHKTVKTEWPVCRLVPRGTQPAMMLGISDEFEYERIAALGGGWDRLVVNMQGIVRDPHGGFRFGHGVDPIPTLSPSSGAYRTFALVAMPKWLSSSPETADYHRYPPTDWDFYQELVGWLVERFRAAGGTHVEVWNEATVKAGWAGGMPELLKLHSATREAVLRSAPEMRVLGGCTHSWNFDHIEDFFRCGGAEHCDGLAIHGYTYQPMDCVAQFDRLEQILDRCVPDRPDFQIHLTEIGFRHPAFSLEDQAVHLARYTLEAVSRPRIACILWFRHTNPRVEILSGYRQNSSTGYALVGNQGGYCRPALASYRFLSRLLAATDSVDAAGPALSRRYRFFRRGVLIGAAGPGASQGVPDSWPLFDHYGARRPPRDGGLSFRLNPDFIELAF
jgi:hypothetical protein